jgi:WD40 repeat protein
VPTRNTVRFYRVRICARSAKFYYLCCSYFPLVPRVLSTRCKFWRQYYEVHACSYTVYDLMYTRGHTAPVLDFNFHPTNENLFVTSSRDKTSKIWVVTVVQRTLTLINTPQVLSADPNDRFVQATAFAVLRGHQREVHTLTLVHQSHS